MGKKKKRKSRVGVKVFAALMLVISMSVGLFLGWRAFEELTERREGDAYYSDLACLFDETETLFANDESDSQITQVTIQTHTVASDEIITENQIAEQPMAEESDYAAEDCFEADEQVSQEELQTDPVRSDALENARIVAAGTDDQMRMEVVQASALQNCESEADAANTSPVPEKKRPLNQSELNFGELFETCPDAVGWIRIDGTKIDYPVVQGMNNFFYMRHLADGTENAAGSIMMDVCNTPDYSDTITIFHGHHMRNDSMFGSLVEYEKEEYWKAHPIIRLYTPYGDSNVEIVAAWTINANTFTYPTWFNDEKELEAFIEQARQACGYETGVDVEWGDHLLLLSTCAYNYNDARFVVLGKIMNQLIGSVDG